MLKIKMHINDNSVYLNGLFIDARGHTCSINKEYKSEQPAFYEIEQLRWDDCEFSLIIMRKA